MSRVRTHTSISAVDDIAAEEGLVLIHDGDARRFQAFDREYTIRQTPKGKVGLFDVEADPLMEDGGKVTVTTTRGRIRKLFRSARDRGGADGPPDTENAAGDD